MATRYYVGTGTKSWDPPPGTATCWSASSGGAGGASRPTSTDAVVFDSNSGSGTCFINPGAVCASITTTGASVTITGGEVGVYGNVTLSSGVDVSGFRPTFQASGTLTSNSKTISNVTVKNGATLTASGSMSCLILTIENGGAVVLPAGVTSYCTSLTCPGSGSSTLNSSSSGSRATLSDSSGTNSLTYITVQDMVLTGGAYWESGSGFTDAGNNSIDFPPSSLNALFAQSLA